MAENTKHILLDADFCIKSVKIASGSSNLMDLIMDFSGCNFYCHEKTLFEISDHNDEAANWLSDHISSGRICLYSDKQILDELGQIYGDLKYNAYCTFLEEACKAYDARYYGTHFSVLSSYEGVPDETIFLTDLAACETAIGKSKSLGEKKSAVLLQFLQCFHPNQVYVFCSDDSGARKGVASFNNVKCLSILAAFVFLKDLGFEKSNLEKYFTSYESLCNDIKQVNFRVWNSMTSEMIRIPCREVFEGIFDGNYEVLQTGDLRLIS